MHRVCLVGCGRIAATHARNLAGRVSLLCYSRTPASAARLAARFGGEVVPSWEQVLRRADIEALVLCSPPRAHCEQAMAGLAAGKSVLVEKPLCVCRDELERIAAAAAGAPAGTRLMVAENYYYKPLATLLRGIVRLGLIGAPHRLEVRKLYHQPARGWRQELGALLEGGIHFVALVSAVAESCGCTAPERVHAEFPRQAAPTAAERRACVELEYGAALRARIDYAWDQPALLHGLLQHSRLEGSQGRVVFESNGLYAYLSSPGRRRLCWPGWGDLMGYRAMMRDFLACLAEPARQPLSNLERARRDLEIVLQAYARL